MPEYLWKKRESRLRRLGLAPLWPLEFGYRVAAFVHRSVYEWGWAPSVRLPAQVVSVGNLTVGGSGKTPLAGFLARALRVRGEKVAILSRGVGGRRSDRVNVVSDGQRVHLAVTDIGDEPVWLAATSPGVPVLAGFNRAALGMRACAVFGTAVLVLDDGFQHHRVQRDLDLVCIDATARLGNGHVLPRGPLREARSALSAADAIVWNRWDSGQTSSLADLRLPAGIPCFRIRIMPRGLRPIEGGPFEACESLRGEPVGLLAAIARPGGLRRELERLGAKVVQERKFSDHHLYVRSEIQQLDPGLLWVTTAKDAIKIPPSWAEGKRVVVLEEEVEASSASELLTFVMERLGHRGRKT